MLSNTKEELDKDTEYIKTPFTEKPSHYSAESKSSSTNIANNLDIKINNSLKPPLKLQGQSSTHTNSLNKVSIFDTKKYSTT